MSESKPAPTPEATHTPGPWTARLQRSRDGKDLGWIIESRLGRIGWASCFPSRETRSRSRRWRSGSMDFVLARRNQEGGGRAEASGGTTVSLTIKIPAAILDGIFRECDRFSDEETGGRLLGFYTWRGTDLHIDVKALIAAGPNAKRSRVSFFQDGDYQERVFRAVEQKCPQIEHLGNWHTHHVNGLRSLSQGDCQTYQKCVNSPNHNTNFFYALLVTHATQNHLRYGVRHFVFVRHAKDFVEVPMRDVIVSDCGVLQL